MVVSSTKLMKVGQFSIAKLFFSLEFESSRPIFKLVILSFK